MGKLPIIPGYKIKKKIGQGGMASVFLCVQERLNRLVAIKLLDIDFIGNPRLSKRFMKEARALSKLNHPNIVSIYDIGKYKNYYFIIMEYLSESLKDRLDKEKKIKPDIALHTILSISDALFYAHSNGVIHRDIKPDNIMFRKDGSPVLLDFGIAKYIGAKTQLTKTGVAIGTPQYMSPEQCNAERLDGRSDIYSLGVVLFEMLTGRIPYTANDIFGIAMKHLKDPVPELKGKLKPYQYIIDRMMEKEKSKRIKNKKELFQIIKNLLNLRNSGEWRSSKNTIEKRVKKQRRSTEKTIHTATKITSRTGIKKKKNKNRNLWLISGVIIALILLLMIIITENPIKSKLNSFIEAIKLFFVESKAL